MKYFLAILAVSLMILVPLAVWGNEEALAPRPFFTGQYPPPLNHDDLEVFKYLMSYETHTNGNRVLLIGYVNEWIHQLRRHGYLAHGVTTRDVYKAYWLKVDSYHDIPFRSAFFKVCIIFEPTDMGMLFEMDRLLVPGGFVGINWLARSPVWHYANSSRFGTLPDFESFLVYLKYKRLGMVFHGVPIWQKQGALENEERKSA